MKLASPSSKKTQQDLIRPKLRKTKVCSFFLEGRCRRGEACGFAHGMVELEVVPDLTKTSICLAWKEGVCANSSANCRFAHGKHDLRVFSQAKQSEHGKDDSNSLLAKPPGLLPPPAIQSADPLPPVWPCGLQPMKVKTPAPVQDPIDLQPMKVMPSTDSLFAQWGHWENETAAGESSSDDGSHSTPSSLFLQSQQNPNMMFMQDTQGYNCKKQFDEATASLNAFGQEAAGTGVWSMEMMQEPFDMSMFEAESDLQFDPFDATSAMKGASYSAVSSFGFSPSSCPFQPSSETEVGLDASTFDGYSPFGGMPRLW